MATSDDSEGSDGTITTAIVKKGPVLLQKTVNDWEDGLLITYRLGSSAGTKLRVRFEDELAITNPKKIGFEAESAPEEAMIAGRSLQVVGTLEKHGNRKFVLGLLGVSDQLPSDRIPTRPQITSIEQQPEGRVEEFPMDDVVQSRDEEDPSQELDIRGSGPETSTEHARLLGAPENGHTHPKTEDRSD